MAFATPVAAGGLHTGGIFKLFDLQRLVLLVGADAIVVAAAWAVFRLGLRVYESGSRMGARM